VNLFWNVEAISGSFAPKFTTGHLYLRTWENPTPDIEVLSIDCESAMTLCAPFLIALSVE